MANEIQVARQVSGKTLYAAVRNRSADVWDDAGQQFVVITAITWGEIRGCSRHFLKRSSMAARKIGVEFQGNRCFCKKAIVSLLPIARQK